MNQRQNRDGHRERTDQPQFSGLVPPGDRDDHPCSDCTRRCRDHHQPEQRERAHPHRPLTGNDRGRQLPGHQYQPYRGPRYCHPPDAWPCCAPEHELSSAGEPPDCSRQRRPIPCPPAGQRSEGLPFAHGTEMAPGTASVGHHRRCRLHQRTGGPARRLPAEFVPILPTARHRTCRRRGPRTGEHHHRDATIDGSRGRHARRRPADVIRRGDRRTPRSRTANDHRRRGVHRCSHLGRTQPPRRLDGMDRRPDRHTGHDPDTHRDPRNLPRRDDLARDQTDATIDGDRTL